MLVVIILLNGGDAHYKQDHMPLQITTGFDYDSILPDLN